jgi:hypothetical protein
VGNGWAGAGQEWLAEIPALPIYQNHRALNVRRSLENSAFDVSRKNAKVSAFAFFIGNIDRLMPSDKIHRGLLRHFMGAGLVDRRIGRAIVLSHDVIGQHPGFNFFTADVREHLSVDLDARAQHLPAFLNHFLSLQRVVDDIAVFVRQIVLAQYGANALAPTARRFQISDNLWFGHNIRQNCFSDQNSMPQRMGGRKRSRQHRFLN